MHVAIKSLVTKVKSVLSVGKASKPGCRIVSGVVSGAAGFAAGAASGAAVGVAYQLQETGSFEGALQAAINGGIAGGIMGGAMGLYSGFRNPFLCFTAGTQVMLRQDEDGNYTSVDIKDIQVGDYVLARDEDDPTGAIGLQRVAQKFVRTSHFITHLAIRDVETGNVENLETTDEHPFWVLSKGWTTAKNLEPGDLVLNPDGTYATVESNHETFHPEGVTVYNFEVEGAHTYFVADGVGVDVPAWVHNAHAEYDNLPPSHRRAVGADLREQQDFGNEHRIVSTRVEHHLFPQEHRSFFDSRGIDVDDHVLDLEVPIHQALHGGGNWGLARAAWVDEWNSRVILEIAEHELLKGRNMTPDELITMRNRLMDDYQIIGSIHRYSRAQKKG